MTIKLPLRIYVAGPYSADNVIDVLKNIGRGKTACADLFSLGLAPFCPWHDESYVTDRYYNNFTVEQFYNYSIAWLLVSDAVLLIGDWESSKGTVKEVDIATKRGIPIFSSLKVLLDWSIIQERQVI
jgi:hypothetical protein